MVAGVPMNEEYLASIINYHEPVHFALSSVQYLPPHPIISTLLLPLYRSPAVTATSIQISPNMSLSGFLTQPVNYRKLAPLSRALI